jgi:hypothetical protein
MKTKNKGGRPPTGRPTGRKVTLYMHPADEAKAKEIGAGNLSAGVRLALQARGCKHDWYQGAGGHMYCRNCLAH